MDLDRVRRRRAPRGFVHGKYDVPLWEAVESGDLQLAQDLLIAGADVHAFADQVLRSAAIRGHIQMVQLLLNSGADPVNAWSVATSSSARQRIATTLDACADAMTTAQRIELAERSAHFVRMRAMAQAAHRRGHLQR